MLEVTAKKKEQICGGEGEKPGIWGNFIRKTNRQKGVAKTLGRGNDAIAIGTILLHK